MRNPRTPYCCLSLCLLLFWQTDSTAAEQPTKDAKEQVSARKPIDDEHLRAWLENMVWHHRYTEKEIIAATGLSKQKIDDALRKWKISRQTKPQRKPGSRLLALPYPGGRHPRIGFLDGAINPQRETKISVFTPWDETSYVVLDVPEAIWSNLGLTYLAHQHVPTIWTKQNIKLKPLEWQQRKDGSFYIQRKLPNGITFQTIVKPTKTAVLMSMKLINGTKQELTDLRVQNCVMLKGAVGFTQQNNTNKIFLKPYSVCHDTTGKRFIISAWQPCDRAWANQKCPCLHSDPKFADCPSGKTVTIRGWLSFYEGNDLKKEIRRIEATSWKTKKLE